MKCQRCLSDEEASYRAHTEEMDIKVCGTCAEEARKLGIAVEVLGVGERKEAQVTSELELQHGRL